MSEPLSLPRSGRTPAEIFEAAGISDETVAVLKGVEPEGLGVALAEIEQTMDAVAFVAHALPRREAIWWAFTCARSAAGDEPGPEVGACLDTAKTWIAEPTEANRRAAFDAASKLGMETPAGAVALAAFLSGPTLGPADGPAIPPDENVGAKAIMGAVGLAALARDPDDPTAALKQFLAQGLELAERVQLWSPPPAEPQG